MNVLAIIPARAGSKGIPNKNFKDLAGDSPLKRVVRCAWEAGLDQVVISTDHPTLKGIIRSDGPSANAILRPPELAQDDTPMIAVVQHVLQQIPGPPDQPILLIQPTQPLREPKHLQQALALLTPEVDSVVSVVELPLTHSRFLQVWIHEGWLQPPNDLGFAALGRRQDVGTVPHLRDGTVYAFWRKTVTTYGNIYGERVKPLIIPPNETCALDTEADWAEAERRIRAQAP